MPITRKLLFIIVLFFSTSVYSFEDLKFFEKNLGDQINHEKLITIKEIEKINSVDQAKDFYSKIFIIHRIADFTFNYFPEQKNSNFDRYAYQITPITGTIVSIGAFGKVLDNEICEGKLDFYESFYKNKYKSKEKFIIQIERTSVSRTEIKVENKEHKKEQVNEIIIIFNCSNPRYNQSMLSINTHIKLFQKERKLLLDKVLAKQNEIVKSEVNSSTDTTGM